MKKFTLMIFVIFALLLTSAGINFALADELPTLRYGEPINQEADPAPIAKVIDEDIRSNRNYPM